MSTKQQKAEAYAIGYDDATEGRTYRERAYPGSWVRRDALDHYDLGWSAGRAALLDAQPDDSGSVCEACEAPAPYHSDVILCASCLAASRN